MPLVRLEVKNEFRFGNPELYMKEEEAVLDGVAVAGLVGVLKQLGDLSEFAADIFHDLHEQVTAISARGHNLLARTQYVEAALPSLEKTIHGRRGHIHFAYAPGSYWHTDHKLEQSHLLSTDLPRFMMDSYEECHDLPRLYLLDKFHTDGIGACLKRYSDPSYFKRMWATSELEKVEKKKKEMKAKKFKRKRSRLKNERVHSSGSSSWHGSSALFASLNIDEGTFLTETTSIPDVRVKPELATTSFDYRTRLNYAERVSDTYSPVLPDDLEYDQLPNSKLQMKQNSPTLNGHGVPNGVRTDDNFTHDTLQQHSLHRSPSVRWDEKIEIVKPISPITCDDTLVACTQDTEPLDEGSDQSDEEHEVTTILGTSDQDKYDTARVLMPLFSENHLDEPTASETDNYLDALNTLESETETDSEYQTKRELNFSGAKVSAESHNSLNDDEFASVSYQVPMHSVENVMSPHTTGVTPDSDHTSGNEFLDNNVLSMSRGFNGDPPPESAPYSPCIQQAELSNMTTTKTSEPQDLPPVDTSNVPSTKFWTNGSILGLEPSKPPDFSLLNNESKDNISGFENCKCDHSNTMETTKLHDRGVPTKFELVATPNESLPLNSSSIENMDAQPYTSRYSNSRDLSGHKIFERTENLVQQIKPPRFFHSSNDNEHDNMPVKQNSERYMQTLHFSECEKIQDTLCKNINSHLDGPDISVAKGTELPVSSNVNSQPNEVNQNAKPISSSLSAFARRILANGFQKKASISAGDISKSSEMVNAEISNTPDAPLQSNHKYNEGHNGIVSQTSYEQNTKENVESGSSRHSVSSYSHYSGHSSPPLEHMKMSFHPMSGLETSKLKLEFPDTTLRKSNEDLMFPSFQLLRGPTHPFQVSGSESDDEALCRSYPCTSEDCLSPHSDSDSELWGEDDKTESELQDDLHGTPPASGSVYSLKETNQMSQIGPSIGSEILEVENGRSYFRSGDAADLPSLDSLLPTNSRGQGKHGSFPPGREGFALQSPNEEPPPPPLPPMKWRMTKNSFPKEVEEDSRISEPVEHFNVVHAQRFSSGEQQEKPIQKPPPLPETIVHANNKMKTSQKLKGYIEPNHHPNGTVLDKAQSFSHHIQDKHDGQKLIGHYKHQFCGSSGQEGGEKEDLLYQIRNKTFNLRRTDTVKPSLATQPATNINVAAILEKANAIRQAVVGSEDGSDNDNWSDG
ncbi:SCAR-like protein 2 [Iris pallida]|uniref:Protein SCAR n=1 Tax=Iris pallida TaxID=29817 RepID=A0AAX6FZQ2_IRIPA|nr:SCAR-like protein 2 [Iris pallida]